MRVANFVRMALLVGLLGFPLSLPSLLGAQENDALVRRVDDHYNHLSSLRAHYTEHYSGMGMDRTEEGMLLLKKPGRMRWSYAAPVGKVFVLDGKFAWFYTPGDAQATRVPAKQLDDLRSPLRFLLGHTQLKKELDNLTVVTDGSGYWISGVPKGMEQRVKLLSLWVTATGAIERMRLARASISSLRSVGVASPIPITRRAGAHPRKASPSGSCDPSAIRT